MKVGEKKRKERREIKLDDGDPERMRRKMNMGKKEKRNRWKDEQKVKEEEEMGFER